MNKIKHLILINVIAIMIVFSINVVSQASIYVKSQESYNVNKYSFNGLNKVSINWESAGIHSADRYDNVFCVQKGKSLRNVFKAYKLKEIVDINGNTATSKKTNKSKIDTINGQLAYGIEYAVDTNDRQQIIWWLVETWKNKVGGNWSSLKNFKVSKGSGSTRLYKKDLTDNTVDVLKEAKSYANSLGKTNNTTNATLEQEKTTQSLTVRDNVNGYKEDGYNAIGPIKLKFQPKLANVTLTDISNGKSDKLDEYTVNDKTGEKTRNYFYLLSATKRPDNDYDTEWATPDGEEFIKSNKSFYIMIEKNYFKDISSLKIKFKTSKPKVDSVTGKILFWDCEDDNTQNMIMVKTERGKATSEAAELTMEVPISGSLKIEKVDKDNHQINLTGAKFMVSNTSTGWVYQNSDGTINTTWNVDDWENNPPTIFKPGDTINNLPVGRYQITEVRVPENYEVNENCKFFVNENGKVTEGTMEKYNKFFAAKGIKVGSGTTVNVQIENKQKYISISGYVWKDGTDGKTTSRNNLYYETDKEDQLLKGVKVRLMRWRKDANGTIYYDPNKDMEEVKSTWTNDNGEYKFEQVEVDDLGRSFVVFEYNGMKYKSIDAMYNYDNGSKAVEHNWRNRTAFDQNYGTISSKRTDIDYIMGTERTGDLHTARVVGIDDNFNEKFNVTAETNFGNEHKVDGYYLNNEFKPGTGQTSINNVNLGLCERDLPDLAVTKDIQNVQLGINGYEHVYNYDRKQIEQSNNGEDGFAVGVKFGNKYGSMSYTRPIYKSDYQYTNSSDPSKELKVYITYKIRLRNQATTIDAKVNELLDYCDDKYNNDVRINTDLNNIGTDGRMSNAFNYTIDNTKDKFNFKYKKLTINTSGITIGAGQTQNIYIQLELSREQIASIMESGSDSNKILDNVAEINSYSSYYKGTNNLYGGIDKDSIPGNARPGETSTYEDDTDSAPSLKLEQKDARQVSGKVFLDNSTSNELQTGKIRVGSGKYEDGEEGILNVQVALKSTTGGKTYYIGEGIEKPSNSGRTDENGDFTISGFIPDKYELVYYWGGQNLKNGEVIIAEDYKGTVVDKNRYDNATQNSLWYQTDPNIRYSDAVDDYSRRMEIDEYVGNVYADESLDVYKNYKRGSVSIIESTTPVMNFRIEESSELEEYKTTSSGIEKQVYTISNIDFGITERARQESEIRKRVSKLKLTLANGQVISEANFTYDKNGKLKAEGETKHMTFMGTNNKDEKMNGQNGFIKLELDNELIQGATLEATYEMEFYNKSELDYQTEQFYKYGIVDDKSKVVKQTPSLVIDYLDDSWSFEESKNEGWKAITTEELKKFTNSVGLDIPEETLSIMTSKGRVLLNEGLINKIENKTILVKASKDAIEPTATQPYQLKVSKVLTTTDDISLENDFGISVISKNGGRLIAKAPGKYVPGETLDDLSDKAEEIIVTSSTGKDLNFVVPITIGIIALITLGTGVILIKKKVIDNK